MELLTQWLIAVALAMDSFSVSIAAGAGLPHVKPKHSLWMAGYFGFFQGVMTLLGWYGGQFFNEWIQPFDHWVAFGLLAFIGAKMIWESFEESESGFRFTHAVLFTLAIATSIDAMGVGLSYSVLDQPVFNFSLLIAAVAFGFSFAGIYLGKWLQSILKNKMDLIGGLILIAIGIKLLADHGVF